MIRQRVILRTPAWDLVARLLTIVFAVAFAYAGVLVVLLALKVSPHTVNSISAYRSIHHHANGLRARDFTTAVSLIAGFGGLLVFLVFALLALRTLPRPYLARTRLELPVDGRGETIVRPRAVERVAEHAALAHPGVVAAAGRVGDNEIAIDVGVSDAAQAVEIITDVRSRVREQFDEHELPQIPVNVTLTGFDRQTTRESS